MVKSRSAFVSSSSSIIIVITVMIIIIIVIINYHHDNDNEPSRRTCDWGPTLDAQIVKPAKLHFGGFLKKMATIVKNNHNADGDGETSLWRFFLSWK